MASNISRKRTANLFAQGAFLKDSDRNGLAAGWICNKPDNYAFSFDVFPGKGRAQKIALPRQKTGAIVLSSERVRVQERTSYFLQSFTKAENVTYCHHFLNWYDAREFCIQNQAFLTPYQEPGSENIWNWEKAAPTLPAWRKSGTWDWEKWAFKVTAPKNARYAQLDYIALHQGGVMWIADVRLTKEA